VIVTEARANRVVDLKPALRREKLDPRRLERVLFREEQGAPVEPAFIRAFLQAKDQEVPVMDVAFLGLSDEVCEILTLQDHFVFCLQSTKSLCHD